jgi:hypothetical protein
VISPLLANLFGRSDRGFAVIQFGEGDFGIGVDEGLLIDRPTPFKVPT